MGANWKSRMVRRHTVEEILPLLIAGETKEIEGHRVAFGSPRLQTFRSGDAPRVTCVNCGLKGAYFVLEQDFGGGWHLDLYAINRRGQEVMMTSDHIVPQSRGGAKNDLSNRQPMCEDCNHRKDDFHVVEERPVLMESGAAVASLFLIEHRGTRYEVLLVTDYIKGDILALPNVGRGGTCGPCMKLPSYWVKDPRSLSVHYLEEKLGLGEGDLEAVQLFLEFAARKGYGSRQ